MTSELSGPSFQRASRQSEESQGTTPVPLKDHHALQFQNLRIRKDAKEPLQFDGHDITIEGIDHKQQMIYFKVGDDDQLRTLKATHSLKHIKVSEQAQEIVAVALKIFGKGIETHLQTVVDGESHLAQKLSFNHEGVKLDIHDGDSHTYDHGALATKQAYKKYSQLLLNMQPLPSRDDGRAPQRRPVADGRAQAAPDRASRRNREQGRQRHIDPARRPGGQLPGRGQPRYFDGAQGRGFDPRRQADFVQSSSSDDSDSDDESSGGGRVGVPRYERTRPDRLRFRQDENEFDEVISDIGDDRPLSPIEIHGPSADDVEPWPADDREGLLDEIDRLTQLHGASREDVVDAYNRLHRARQTIGELAEEIEGLNRDRDRLLNEFEALNAAKVEDEDSLLDEIRSLAEENARLNEALNVIDEALNEKNRQYNELAEACGNLQGHLEHLIAEADQNARDAQFHAERAAGLEDELTQRDARIQAMETELRNRDDQIGELGARLDFLRGRLRAAREQEYNLQRQINELSQNADINNARIQALTDQLDQTSARADAIGQQIPQLIQYIGALERSNEGLRGQIARTVEVLAQQQRIIGDLREGFDAMQGHINALQREAKNTAAQHRTELAQAAESERKNLEAQADRFTQMGQHMIAQIRGIASDIGRNIDALLASKQEIEQELADAQARIRELTAGLEVEEKRSAGLERDLQRVQVLSERREDALGIARQDLDHLRKILGAKNDEINQLRGEQVLVEGLAKELDARVQALVQQLSQSGASARQWKQRAHQLEQLINNQNAAIVQLELVFNKKLTEANNANHELMQQIAREQEARPKRDFELMLRTLTSVKSAFENADRYWKAQKNRAERAEALAQRLQSELEKLQQAEAGTPRHANAGASHDSEGGVPYDVDALLADLEARDAVPEDFGTRQDAYARDPFDRDAFNAQMHIIQAQQDEKRITDISKEVDSLNQKVVHLHNEIRALYRLLAAKDKKITELEASLKNLLEALGRKEVNKNDLQQKAAEAVKEASALVMEVGSLREKVKQITRDRDEADLALNKATEALVTKEAAHAGWAKEQEKLFEFMRKEIERQKQHITDLETKLSEALNAVAQSVQAQGIEDALTEAKKHLAEMQAQIAATNTHASQQSERAEAAERSLADQKGAIAELSARIKELEGIIEQLKSSMIGTGTDPEVESLKEQIEGLKTLLKQALARGNYVPGAGEHTFDALQADAEDFLREEIEERLTQGSRPTSPASGAGPDVDTDELQSQLADMQGQLENMQRQLDEADRRAQARYESEINELRQALETETGLHNQLREIRAQEIREAEARVRAEFDGSISLAEAQRLRAIAEAATNALEELRRDRESVIAERDDLKGQFSSLQTDSHRIITDLRSRNADLVALEEEVNQIRQERGIKTDTSLTEGIRGFVQGLQGAVQDYEKEIEELNRRLKFREGELNGDIEQLRAENQQFKQQVAEFNAQLAQWVKAASIQIPGVETPAALSNAIIEIRNTVTQMQADLERKEAFIAQLKQEIVKPLTQVNLQEADDKTRHSETPLGVNVPPAKRSSVFFEVSEPDAEVVENTQFLEEQIADLQQKNQQLQIEAERAGKLAAQVDALMVEGAKAKDKLAGLPLLLVQLEKQKQQINDLTTERDDYADAEARRQDDQASDRELESELSALQAKHTSLESEAVQLRERDKTQQERLSQQDERLAEQEAKLTDTSQREQEASRQATTLANEIANISKKAGQQGDQLRDLTEKLSELEREKQQMKAQVGALEEELQKAKATIESLRRLEADRNTLLQQKGVIADLQRQRETPKRPVTPPQSAHAKVGVSSPVKASAPVGQGAGRGPGTVRSSQGTVHSAASGKLTAPKPTVVQTGTVANVKAKIATGGAPKKVDPKGAAPKRAGFADTKPKPSSQQKPLGSKSKPDQSKNKRVISKKDEPKKEDKKEDKKVDKKDGDSAPE